MDKNIVLIHGWGAKIAKLKYLETELKNLGWKVYLPKLPGFDLSPPIDPWSVENYSDFVYDGASKNFKSFLIFGHSFGGRVAVDMTSKHDNISGLVLCATSGITRGNLFKRYALQAAAKIGKPLASTKYKKFLYKAAHEHDYEKSEGVMKATFKNVIDYSIKPIIPNLTVPVLVLWGKVDRMTPVKDADYISRVTNSKKIIYDNYGHTLPYINSDNLAKDIDLWYTQLKQ